MKIQKIFYLLLFSFLSMNLFSGENSILMEGSILIIEAEGTAFLGSGITEFDAKTLAINDAKRTAIEQAGTYLESHTQVINHVLVKDEIITYTGGLLKLDILNVKRMLINDMFALKAEIKVTIDTKLLNERIEELKTDNELKKMLEVERKRSKELEERVEKLQTSLNSVTKQEIKQIVNALTATDFFNNGLSSFKTGNYDAALYQYTQAISLDPNYINAYNNRGVIFCIKQLYNEAIADFNYVIEKDPADPDAYLNRGNAYNRRAMYDEAILDYNQVLRINPNDVDAYFNRANAYGKKGMYDEAISDYTNLLKISPNDVATYYKRGNMYLELGEYNKAISDYNQVLSLDSKYSDAYFARGNIYFDKGMYDKAIYDYSQALNIEPRNIKIYLNRGNIYFYKGLYDEAISDYTNALKIDANYAKAYHGRGSCYVKKELFDKASADYNEYLRLAGNKDGIANEIRELILKMGYTPKY